MRGNVRAWMFIGGNVRGRRSIKAELEKQTQKIKLEIVKFVRMCVIQVYIHVYTFGKRKIVLSSAHCRLFHGVHQVLS